MHEAATPLAGRQAPTRAEKPTGSSPKTGSGRAAPTGSTPSARASAEGQGYSEARVVTQQKEFLSLMRPAWLLRQPPSVLPVPGTVLR